MKIPFLQHIGIGLHITHQGIRWVELSRIRDKLSLKQSFYQEIGNNDISNSLQKLVEKIQPEFPFVTVNINSTDVLQKAIEVPFQDDEYLEEWLIETAAELLPEGSELEEYHFSHQIIESDSERRVCLFILAREEVIESRIKLLKAAGLQPVGITTGDLESAYGLVFDTDFTTGTSKLVKAFEDSCCLIEYKNGFPANLYLLPEIGHAREAFEETESILAGYSVSKGREGTSEVYSFTSDKMKGRKGDDTHLKVVERAPLSHLSIKGNTLTQDEAVACGMAVKQLYTALDDLNLLDDQQFQSVRNNIEKKDAILTGSVTAGIVLIFFLFLTVIEYNVEKRRAAIGNQVSEMEDKIVSVTEARQNVEELKSTVSQARGLVQQQISTVLYLQPIGKALPEGLWLQELAIDVQTKRPVVKLEGFSIREAFVSKLLENLEKLEEISSVRLIFSEKVATDDFYEKMVYRQRQLIQFGVEIKAVNKE